MAETQPQFHPALGVVDHSRRRFAQFELVADFLDLRSLFFKLAVMALIISDTSLVAQNGGGCHSKPNLSKTGLSANLKDTRERFTVIILKNGARSGKKLGFQSAAKPMNPETRPKRRSVAPSGRDTPNSGFTFVLND
jgi:hypothetical protein